MARRQRSLHRASVETSFTKMRSLEITG